MDCVLKRPGYFPLLGFLIVVALFCSSACSLFEKEYKAEGNIVLPDGTEAEAGQTIYVDSKGKATANAVDPETNEPNKKLMVPDVERIEKYKEQGEKAAGGLPAPFSTILLAILGIGGPGAIAGARLLRKKKLDDAGVPTKKKA